MRLIDADRLESYLLGLYKFFDSFPCGESDKVTKREIKRCISEVKKASTINVASPVMHGRWDNLEGDPMWQKCSVCGFVIQYSYSKDCNYCPNCGADMRERKDND